MSVFVDTGVLYAAAVERDRHHPRAKELLGSLENTTTFTTDHVLVEVWALIEARYGWSQAMTFWRALRGTALVTECVTLPDIERAQAIAEGWTDLEFDLVDCTSFAVAERLGCTRAASFDADFAVYRFGSHRKEAFEILR